MNIEEKAKTYDEAIAKLKRYEGSPTLWSYSDICEKFFPELAESEDEKIRKAIRTIILSASREQTTIVGVAQSDMFAWLEKQGEKEKFIKKELDCIRGYRKEAIRRLQELEKQGESTEINPSEFDLQLNRLLKQFKSLPKEDLASSLSFYLNVVQNDGTYKEEKQGEQKHQYNSRPKYIGEEELLGEQKPAEWSEEDETMLKRVIDFIPQCMTSHGYNEYINWFKDLKNRVQPQPKQEWSEEDEEMVQVAINACNSYQDSLVRNDSRFDKAVKAEEWLKSLKERYTWKPSDEQLKSLKEIIDQGHFTSYPNALETLYEQLKKL